MDETLLRAVYPTNERARSDLRRQFTAEGTCEACGRERRDLAIGPAHDGWQCGPCRAYALGMPST
jgi:hypothetical protein